MGPNKHAFKAATARSSGSYRTSLPSRVPLLSPGSMPGWGAWDPTGCLFKVPQNLMGRISVGVLDWFVGQRREFTRWPWSQPDGPLTPSGFQRGPREDPVMTIPASRSEIVAPRIDL